MAWAFPAATSELNLIDRDRWEVMRMPISSERILPTSFWRFEVDSQTLIPSDRCRRLYGLPPDAPFSYAEFCAAVHPDDREIQARELSRAIETGRLYAKLRVVWPDGSVHRIQMLGSVSPPSPASRSRSSARRSGWATEFHAAKREPASGKAGDELVRTATKMGHPAPPLRPTRRPAR
jgi:hypothetical protein